MNTTTIRLPEQLEQFLDRTDNSASEISRNAIRDKFYDNLAGLCAKCGEVVFISDGHTNVSTSTPLGNAVNPSEPVTEFDLCEDCSEGAYNLVSQEDPDSFSLDALETNGEYQYVAMRQAITDLGSNDRSAWSGIVSSRDDARPLKPTGMPEQLLANLITWADWKSTVDEASSDGMSSCHEYSVSELLAVWDNVTIEFMYENVHIADLIEQGVLPETADEAI